MIETTRPELVAYQKERLAFCRGLHHGAFLH